MNKSIYEVNNSLNLSQFLNKNFDNENELKVDEISDSQGMMSNSVKNLKSVFDLTETSFIKKHSMTLLTIKEILPNGQEDRFITNDDEVEKKMIQSIEEKKEKK